MKTNKVKLVKPPMPEVCDACLLEDNLKWDNEAQEWLCGRCSEIIREDRKLFDYEDGQKHSNYNGNEW